MPKCTLRPSGDVVEIPEGVNLLQALKNNDIYIKSSCGGHASCTDCVIKIVSGDDLLTPAPFDELKLLGNVFHITKERLACQTSITGDVTIDISGHDKGRDEERIRKKTSQFTQKKTRVRKKEEVEQIQKERELEREEFEAKSHNEGLKWEKHWDKEKDPNKPKRLGGSKRPKRS